MVLVEFSDTFGSGIGPLAYIESENGCCVQFHIGHLGASQKILFQHLNLTFLDWIFTPSQLLRVGTLRVTFVWSNRFLSRAFLGLIRRDI